ncbi:hypothetical protein CBS101457_004288 [Exobasidium rhododendri]|nr:hypothetical protein CBS101457_004288 [Exobasidium rhododendri]
MTSICSSPPAAIDANLAASPAHTSSTALPHTNNQRDIARPAERLQQQMTLPALPRGHDSSDVAALSQATSPSHVTSSVYGKAERDYGTNTSTQANGHETTCLADDTDPQGPFEGPEKLLELWFADCQDEVTGQGLKIVKRQVWEDMLDIVKCKVLSTIHGSSADAFLLSESSMFVFPHKIILKTCGTTTLLLGLERILQIAHTALGHVSREVPTPVELGSIVKRCFYSRKSFMFPERQKGPHKDWMLEVGLLDRFFEQGSAYTVGKMNGDHWLLYMTSPCESGKPQLAEQQHVERPLRLPSMGHPKLLSDQTLEVLMTYLSPTTCSRFEFPSELPDLDAEHHPVSSLQDRGHLLGTRLCDQLGLTTLFPNTLLDAFAFEPCGFSANAVIQGDGKTVEDAYWTIHVTPEQDSSYASFETNSHMEETVSSDKKDLPWLISRVLSIFEPGRLSVTLFTSSDHGSADDKEDQGDVLHSLQLTNYKRTDRIAYEFEDYDLVFVSFDKQGMSLPRR